MEFVFRSSFVRSRYGSNSVRSFGEGSASRFDEVLWQLGGRVLFAASPSCVDFVPTGNTRGTLDENQKGDREGSSARSVNISADDAIVFGGKREGEATFNRPINGRVEDVNDASAAESAMSVGQPRPTPTTLDG